jgi:hypothetical protein
MSSQLLAVYRRFIVPACAAVHFAQASDRAVTGSINELVIVAKTMLVENDLPPFRVGFGLNDVLLSAIAPSKSAKYGKPREASKALAGGIES